MSFWKIFFAICFWPFVLFYYICRAFIFKLKGIYKVSKKRKSSQDHDIFFEPLDRLVDGRLPKRWLYVYGEMLRSREACFPILAKQANKCEDLDEKISLLEELIEKFYDYKNYCYSKDECFIKYFNDLWMHCHNSKNADFCYITPFEEELNYLKTNHNSIIKYKETLKKIENEIINIVYQHPEGILQIDVVKQFPEEYKDELNSHMIYSLIKNKTLLKEKRGKYNLLLPNISARNINL